MTDHSACMNTGTDRRRAHRRGQRDGSRAEVKGNDVRQVRRGRDFCPVRRFASETRGSGIFVGNPRWAKIRRITTGCSMIAMRRKRPPQLETSQDIKPEAAARQR